jgi:hypothetical protein
MADYANLSNKAEASTVEAVDEWYIVGYDKLYRIRSH